MQVYEIFVYKIPWNIYFILSNNLVGAIILIIKKYLKSKGNLCLYFLYSIFQYCLLFPIYLDEARHLYTNVPMVSTESAFNLLANQYKRSVYSVEDSSSVPTNADAKNSFKVSTP